MTTSRKTKLAAAMPGNRRRAFKEYAPDNPRQEGRHRLFN